MQEEDIIDKNKIRDKKTAFHGGFSYLERIDRLLRALDEVIIPEPEAIQYHNLICGLSMFRHSQRLALLKSLFHELYPKMNDDLKEKHTLNRSIADDSFRTAENEVRKNQKRITITFIKYFDRWEMLLRKFVEEKGLLMPTKKDGLDATDD